MKYFKDIFINPKFPGRNHINDYEDYWKSRGFNLNEKLKPREEIFVSWVGKEKKVLDFGCGNSRLGLDLKLVGNEVTVSDISQVVLESQEKLGLKTLKIDLRDLNVGNINEKFDYIVLSEVLEHIPYPEGVLVELSKILNGEFILTVPNSAFYKYRLQLLLSGRFMVQWVWHPNEHLRYWSHIDFIDWLDAIGFEVVKFQASTGLRKFFGIDLKKIWPNMFGNQICYLVKVK